jgi:hypothetical protein
MTPRRDKPPREIVLERIEFYGDVGATASEISDETLLSLREIKQIIEKLADEGSIMRNGLHRHCGKKKREHAVVWIGTQYARAS